MPVYRVVVNIPLPTGGVPTWEPKEVYAGRSKKKAASDWGHRVKTIVEILAIEQKATGGSFNGRPVSPTVLIFEDDIVAVTFDPQAWAVTMQPGWEKLLGGVNLPNVN